MNFSFLKKMNRNTILVGIAIIAIIITGVLIFANSRPGGYPGFSLSSIFGMSDSQIGKKAVDYINSSGLSTTPAALVSVSETSGIVKVKIKIGTNEFDSYVTKDGKFLFPQAFDMSAKTTAASTNQNASANTGSTPAKTPAEAAAAIAKTNNPILEAYIVARCPYGLQMQRVMADAIASIPSISQYLKVRYIGSVSGSSLVSMHGDAEAKENLRQICIREEQPAKYWNYVACQMKSGDTAGCETSTGVDSAKLNACTSDASRGITYAQKDFTLDSKYNVSGSPTMILDGTQVSEFDFGGRTSDAIKSLVCAAFSTKPAFCSTQLKTTDAATSFSATYSSSASANSGNSGTTGANCAPAQ